MIYIRTKYDQLCEDTSIIGVYQVYSDDVEKEYLKFMLQKATELNLVVNPHWLMVMNYELHNSHLTKTEYNKKSKEWVKIRRQWNIAKFICDLLNGHKLDYVTLSF